MANQIPEKLINFRVYNDGEDDHIGTADITLFNMASMTETISGSGLAGEVDSPTLGHFQSMTLGIKWRVINKPFLQTGMQTVRTFDIRGAVQVFDAGNGEYSVLPVKIVTRVVPKSTELGTFGVAKATDSNAEFEVLQFKASVDGKEVIELDKYNYIFKVNGTDYLSAVRKALGLSS